MGQNKITVVIENRNLFEIISEIIDQINNKSDLEFELTSYNSNNLAFQNTIIVDSDTLKIIEIFFQFNLLLMITIHVVMIKIVVFYGLQLQRQVLN